jgi:ADP-ribose pyrophosphatase YjhB (NUDIX family)
MNNSAIACKTHSGVYGIILKDASILLIRKSRGPYIGRLDLPGGRPEYCETIQQALAREVAEETGVTIGESALFDNYTITVEWSADNTVHQSMYHIGMIYMVVAYDDSGLIHDMHVEDSAGAQWYQLKDLTEDMLSPFAYQVVMNKGKNV